MLSHKQFHNFASSCTSLINIHKIYCSALIYFLLFSAFSRSGIVNKSQAYTHARTQALTNTHGWWLRYWCTFRYKFIVNIVVDCCCCYSVAPGRLKACSHFFAPISFLDKFAVIFLCARIFILFSNYTLLQLFLYTFLLLPLNQHCIFQFYFLFSFSFFFSSFSLIYFFYCCYCLVAIPFDFSCVWQPWHAALAVCLTRVKRIHKSGLAWPCGIRLAAAAAVAAAHSSRRIESNRNRFATPPRNNNHTIITTTTIETRKKREKCAICTIASVFDCQRCCMRVLQTVSW